MPKTKSLPSKNLRDKFATGLALILGVLIMSFLVGYLAFAAWSNPTALPPGNNTEAPINVGSTGQTKTGNLTVNNLYLTATSEGNFYNINQIIGFNDLLLYGNSTKNAPIYLEGSSVIINNDAGTGNVGIGTTNPGYKLDVSTDVNIGTRFNIAKNSVLYLPSNNPETGPWNPIWNAIGSSKPIYFDEEFASGNNSVSVYNNSGGSSVTITRQTGQVGVPNSTGVWLKVSYDGIGPTSPNFGGVVQIITSVANKTFVQRFRAKVPVGKTLNINENSQGTNSTSYWLTNNVGTGKWEDYIRVSHTGNTGTFSSGGHISISGGSGAFDWYIASMNVYEVNVPLFSSPNTWLSAQIFSGGANFPGSGIWNTSGNVGINQTAPGAKLAVNNPTTAGKVGATGDAIYAYANNTNAAISAEQGGTGYAGYFSGNVAVTGTLTASSKNVCLADGTNCPGGSNLWTLSGTNIYNTNTTGNVGIGTTSPGAKLDVGGNIYSSSARLTTGTDLNTLTRWSINDVESPTNGVTGQTWHNIITIPSADTNYITQLNFGMVQNYPNMWLRTKYAGSWGSWYKLWHSNNDGTTSGLDADLLDGAEPSMVAGNSTIVQRNASGYVFANYFNTTADVTGTAASHFAIQTGSDSYIRWQTPANARTSLGLGAGGSGDIWVEKGGDTMTGTLTFSGVATDITTGANEHLSLMPNGTGNVGIGTTGPGYKLDVQGGQINASGGLCIAGSCKTSWGQLATASGLWGGDVRTIAPNSFGHNLMSAGFTSYSNNNTAPWADYMILNSYGDASGGNDNLLTFSRSAIHARMWQQSWNSASAFSSYKDFLFGSGTQNYLSKFTSDYDVLGNSLIYDNGTNVGIGTTGPGYKLDVVGDMRASNFYSNNANPYLNFSSYFIAPGGAYFNSGTVYTEAAIQVRGGINNDSGSNGGDVNINESLRISGAVTCLQGYCPSNSAMRMTPNFHLNALGGYAVILNWDNGTTGTAQTFRIGNGAGSDVFWVRANGETYAAGNVGIGTTTPSYKLHVSGDVGWTGTLQAGTVPWARITSFPVACTGGQFVTAVGATLTCSTPVGGVANAFANIANSAGTVQFSASGADTVRLAAGSGLSIAFDAVSKMVTYTNTGDLSSTDEIQNIIASKGLQRDASNNFGIINCATDQIMKYNVSGQWVCATDVTGIGGEADTLQTVTNRGNTTTLGIGVGGNLQVDGAITAPEGTLWDDGGGWVRTYGATGWYSQTYGGGWYMTDTTWIRAYNNKYVRAAYFYSDSLGAYATAGSGTAGYLTRWTGTYTQGNSVIYDNGTNVGIGTTGPTNKLSVQGVSGGTGFSGSDGTGGVRVRWSTGYGVTLDAWDGGTPRWGITKYSAETPTVMIEGRYNSTDVIFNAGNVGIGTTAPGAKLEAVDTTIGNISGAIVEGRQNGGFATLTLRGRDGDAPTVALPPDQGPGLSFQGFDGSSFGNMARIGAFSESTLSTSDHGGYLTFFTVADGTTLLNERMRIDHNGNVGIGTSAPGYKLDVVSGGATTARFGTASSDTVVIGGGTGKVTFGTADPTYTIAGEKYATYMADMVGQKQETVGLAEISKCVDGKDYYEFIIDFDKVEKGSDLWLFAKTSNIAQNIDKLVVLLTPKGNTRVWYETDRSENQLIFYASQPTTVSYRLTAPRFDWEKWPNTAKDADVSGFIIEDSGK